ncbi:helix-turn-helix domain-containing protein [Streptomyces sp. NPDC006430]|uniref:helix-turn-helix domain-containing protein n=1 Tax=Streptomyces sp. NPDC006430 TaxID=3154299 RepID=UPI0033B2CD90
MNGSAAAPGFGRIDGSGRPGPSATSVVAAHHNISVRTLHHLFHGQEESVHARIRRRRLEECRAELARPDLRARQVSAIAAGWGFSGPSVGACS